MNKEYIENFRLIGFEVKDCKTMKEFVQDIKDRCDWYCYGDVSFRKYMNDEISGALNCISDGWEDEDACIFIEYKDGSKYTFFPALGVEGKFKENGIKWAILSDAHGYTVYNDDLSVEWENLELDVLDEIQREALSKRIPVETLKLQKRILSELKEAEPEQEQSEQEQSEQGQSEQEQSEQGQSEQEQSEQGQSEQEQSEQGQSEQKIVYKIDILKALKEAGYNQGRIKREKLLNGSAVDKIRAGSTDISLKTVSVICNLLNAEPGDILTMATNPQKEGKKESKEVAEAPGASEPEQSEPEQFQAIPQKKGKEEPKQAKRI